MKKHTGILSLFIAIVMVFTIIAVPTDAVAAKKTATKKTSVKKKKSSTKKKSKPAKLRSTRATIEVGSTVRVVLQNRPSGVKVAYSSSNGLVAVVNSKGVVSGVGVGKATIRVKLTRKKTKKQSAYKKTLNFSVEVTPTQYDQDKAVNFGFRQVTTVVGDYKTPAYPNDIIYSAIHPRTDGGPQEDDDRFTDGLARFSRTEDGSKKWGYVDYNGTTVINASYDILTPFKKGICMAVNDNGTDFYAKTGQLLSHTGEQFDIFNDFHDGLALVGIQYREYTYIDGRGQITPGYNDMSYDYSCGLAVVANGASGQHGEAYGYLNTNGELAISANLDIVERIDYFSDDMASFVYSNTGKCGFIDQTGKVVIPPIYDRVLTPFKDGVAQVEMGGDSFYIDKEGNVVS